MCDPVAFFHAPLISFWSFKSCWKLQSLSHPLKVGLGISRTNADLQWNPVYNVFHQSFFVETKRFVGSFVNVIFTRQTYGQRSSRTAERKRWAIGNYFSEQICYMFLISKCTGDWDLGLFTTSGLVFGEPQCNDKFQFFLRRNTFFPPEVATALQFSKRKSRSCTQIWI